jgi:hypothetical protein
MGEKMQGACDQGEYGDGREIDPEEPQPGLEAGAEGPQW